MSKFFRSKWAMLTAGSALMALQIGQCIGDLIEDAIVFRWVN
jgi:hypothetical protein